MFRVCNRGSKGSRLNINYCVHYGLFKCFLFISVNLHLFSVIDGRIIININGPMLDVCVNDAVDVVIDN